MTGIEHTVSLRKRTDNPREMIPPAMKAKEISKVAIIGFGTMGVGIAVDVLRRMRIPVIAKDTEKGLENGMMMLKKNLEALKLPVNELLGLLTPTTVYGKEFSDVDLVIEAVFENYDLKQLVYQDLCKVVGKDCIIASNTSTIPITKLAANVEGPERFIGAHFFSPVPRMELLEVIKGELTSQQTIYDLIGFAASIKKRPLICNDSPGFVVNALLLPYFQTTFELLEKGVSIEAIDGAMVKFGMPVGPVRLIEEVGIDVPYNSFYAIGLTPPDTLKNMVENGRLGFRKSGKGFFLKDGSVDPDALPFIAVKSKGPGLNSQNIQEMLLSCFVKKGQELLDSKVVDDPGDIDIGAIWGLGFPTNTGGPLKWADLSGLSTKLFGVTFYKGEL